jgi:hypothetical protein
MEKKVFFIKRKKRKSIKVEVAWDLEEQLFAVTSLFEEEQVALVEWLYFFKEFLCENSLFIKEMLINVDNKSFSPHDFLLEIKEINDWITRYSAVRVEYLQNGVSTQRRKYFNFCIDKYTAGVFVNTYKEYPTANIGALLCLLPKLQKASKNDKNNAEFEIEELQSSTLLPRERIEFKNLFETMEVYIEGYKKPDGSYVGITVYGEKYIFREGECTLEKDTTNQYFEGLVVSALREDVISELEPYFQSDGTNKYPSILCLEISTEDIVTDPEENEQQYNLQRFWVKKAKFLREEPLSAEEKQKIDCLNDEYRLNGE